MRKDNKSRRRISNSKSRFLKPKGRKRNFRSQAGRSRPSRGRKKASRYSGKGKGGETVDIAYFIRQASNAPKPKEHIIKHTFADFGFDPKIQKNLKTLKYITPTPIQDQAIPRIMDGQDVVGMANTGTGKTGAFLIPLIDKIVRDPSQKVLVITPTRELAMQIDYEFRRFSRDMGISSVVCIGGAPMYRQVRSIKSNPNIVIGTPGRLEDLGNRKTLQFGIFNSVVLDEVDRMLDMGFINSVRSMLSQTALKRQSLFFSATMPAEIRELVKQFSREPVTVSVSQGTAAHNVEQEVIRIQGHSAKLKRLKEVLKQPEFEKVLIFSETKRGVEKLTQDLYRTGFKVDSIHGDKRQRQREKSLSHFRSSRINILVATDVAARGLDIKEITHVINYTVPQSYDDYIHRIGRTGRGTNKGTALTFI